MLSHPLGFFHQSRLDSESDRLIDAWGAQASEIASILAFRAQAGLLHEKQPGFWKGVLQRVGDKIGIPDETRLGRNLLAP